MKKDLFPIEDEVYEELNKLAKVLYSKEKPDSEWTKKFKKALFELGETKHGYRVWGADERSEWLWDLCWVRIRDEEWKDFRGVYLACEIEWKSDEDSLLGDFLKLTVTDVEFRLFVCTVTEEKFDRMVARLMRVCPGSKGARYMVIGVPRSHKSEELLYRAWTL